MSPLILDGDIVVVYSSPHDVKSLDGKIVVAWHRKSGLSLSRFLVMRGVQLLESENRITSQSPWGETGIGGS